MIGVPLVGIGAGGASHFKGEVIRAQIEELLTLQRGTRAKFDVAVVAYSAEDHAAAQQARKQLLVDQSKSDQPSDLRPAEVRTARRLSGLARRGELVLFIGAGVSTAAGLPNWNTLLSVLSRIAGVRNRKEFAKLDPLDQARLIQRGLKEKQFQETMGKLFANHREQSLAHQLLASLPVSEAATTNYDTLFEEAWRRVRRRVAVLPDENPNEAEAWLLKLHGTIQRPKSLVLSRDDYLRMDREGAALAGVVQAMLITRHMLFVGYSLDDDRFHRIAHDVRQAIGAADERPDPKPFATALTPTGNPALQDLWDGDIGLINFGQDGLAAGGRRIDIFLDYLLAEAHEPAPFLKDPTFEALWSDHDREVRETLLELERVSSMSRSSSVAASVRSVLSQLWGERQ